MAQASTRSEVPGYPLSGFRVLEIGGGAAAAYCGRLLVDAGAQVSCVAKSEAQRIAGIVRGENPADVVYASYLSAGKSNLPATAESSELAALGRDADLVIVGEASGVDASSLRPRIATIELSWFGKNGPCSSWQGGDLIVQALSGLPHMAGKVEGPPIYPGDRHSTSVGGVTAYITACAAILAAPAANARRYEISILEANIVLAEMHMHFFERDSVPMKRCGLNRFSPNGPVGIYPCKEGWVGITVTTPDQWRSVCKALELHEQAADERLVTRELRFDRLDEVETAISRALSRKTAMEWAAIGRQFKIPLVVVPDAQGVLLHPIFAARASLAWFRTNGRTFQVPRTPFGLSRTPVRRQLDEDGSFVAGIADEPGAAASADHHAAPLAGVTVVDFTMGWAGPLASRLLGDLGANVLKIEAGRYPDWWRGVNWTPEYIVTKMYENAKPFCALNRSKRGASIDLTQPTGRDLAMSLISRADIVIENQAAGVMAKFKLGYEDLLPVNPSIVMTSMSAFGTGNAWSDTRAYGSTLEQGSGLPSFTGFPGTAPMMTHLAYGDPVGGLYGCAATLTALISKRRTGEGQYVNVSMVEAMLQFGAQALLEHQLDLAAELRRGNRHPSMVPHGIYASAGTDCWIALSSADAKSFASLARLIGMSHWADDTNLGTLAGRKARIDEIDAAIAAWASKQNAGEAARALQAAGVAAAEVVHAEEVFDHPEWFGSDFFVELQREFSGPQKQAGLAVVCDGKRLGSRQPAPLLGEHSWEIMSEVANLSRSEYDRLVRDGIISFQPAPTRNLVAPPRT